MRRKPETQPGPGPEVCETLGHRRGGRGSRKTVHLQHTVMREPGMLGNTPSANAARVVATSRDSCHLFPLPQQPRSELKLWGHSFPIKRLKKEEAPTG